MYPVDVKIVEVAEAIGAENAKKYTDKGWVVLGTVTYYDGEDGTFIYALGRPASVSG